MARRFCTQCGQPIPDDGKFCTNCGAPIPVMPKTDYKEEPKFDQREEFPFEKNPDSEFRQQPHQEQPIHHVSSTPNPSIPRPKSYLVLSILATILCCLPLGIPAIVYSAKVDNLWNEGRYIESDEASRKAKRWMLASVIVALAAYLIYFILIGIAIASGIDISEYLNQ